jgi:hypothetical protein
MLVAEQDLRQLLRSTYGHRSAHLSDQIVHRKLQLSACRSRIATAQSIIGDRHATSMDELLKEEEMLSFIVEGLQSLQSPVRLLPPEILSRVFLLVNANSWGIEARSIRTIRIPVLPSSQVCSVWRNVALSTHGFWSKIRLWLDESEGFAFLVQKCLERSGGAGLDLQIMGYLTGTKVIKHLVEHSYHWRTVVFQMDLEVWKDPVLQDIRGNLPILEDVCLCTDQSRPDELAVWQDLFEDTPRLRTFMTTGMQPYLTLGTQSNFFSLVFEGPQIAEVIRDCLSRSPHIETLSLSSRNNDTFSAPSPITVRALQKLKVGRYENDHYIGKLAFRLLTLPHLTSLEIEGSTNIFYSAELLPSFLERSACTITSLTLKGLDIFAHPVIITLLEMVPSLQCLTIHATCTRYIDPKLETLFCRFHRRVDVDPGSVLSSSNSWSFLPKLTALKVTVEPNHVAMIIEELKELLNAGRRKGSLSAPEQRDPDFFGYLDLLEIYEWGDCRPRLVDTLVSP